MLPFGPDSKRWAQRARDTPFSELSSVRATAEQWRNGLAGLTALLSAAALITSPSLATTLTTGWRAFVGILALTGLLALTFGTWQAMRAAFGVPGSAIPMTGERLKAWEQQQATDAVGMLNYARSAFLSGIMLIVAASAVAFSAQPLSAPPGQAVVITTIDQTLCGHLGSGSAGQLTLTSADGRVHTVQLISIKNLALASSC